MKKVIIMSFLILAFTMPLAQASKFEKYPDNAEKKFLGADEYYQQANRSEYTEYPDSVFKLRENVLYKDINKVFSNVPKQFNTTSGVGDGVGYNQKRQVYIFISAKYVNKKLFSQHAVFDAETGRKISSAK